MLESKKYNCKCNNCQKKLIRRIRDNNKFHYCSNKCKKIHYKILFWKNVICAQCNRKFKIKPSVIHSKKVFCNRSCRTIFLNNERYKNHKKTTPLRQLIKNSKQYKYWQYKIYNKFYYKCSICNNEDYLHAHHIKEFALILNEFLLYYSNLHPEQDKDKLLQLALEYQPFWDLNNGQCLCFDCHQQKHPKIPLRKYGVNKTKCQQLTHQNQKNPILNAASRY